MKPELPPGTIPEGATHFFFNPNVPGPTNNPWRRFVGDSWQMFGGDVWRVISSTKAHMFVAISDVLKADAWSGDGLPPVGTVCEVRADAESQWCKAIIQYASAHVIVWRWAPEEGFEHKTDFAGEVGTVGIRRLLSAEEIAEQEMRALQIEELSLYLAEYAGKEEADIREVSMAKYLILDRGYARV